MESSERVKRRLRHARKDFSSIFFFYVQLETEKKVSNTMNVDGYRYSSIGPHQAATPLAVLLGCVTSVPSVRTKLQAVGRIRQVRDNKLLVMLRPI